MNKNITPPAPPEPPPMRRLTEADEAIDIGPTPTYIYVGVGIMIGIFISGLVAWL